MLRWTFDGDGGWEATSAYHDDGNPFVWRIGVCDDGTFAVSESDSELTNRKETFSTLDAAKAYCQYEENANVCTGEPLPNPTPEQPRYYPLPWSVRYFKRCEEWHDKSCPHVVDGLGKIVLEVACTVGHPGEYDFIADRTCQNIVSAVNSTGKSAAALSEAEIAAACADSFGRMWECETAWQLRQHVNEDIARTIHSYGFHSAGEWVSEHDSRVIDGLLAKPN